MDPSDSEETDVGISDQQQDENPNPIKRTKKNWFGPGNILKSNLITE